MKTEKIDFLCDQALFKGKIFMPDDLADCKGMIIFIHGLGYCTKSYAIDGDFFSKNGYLLLTYNLRGHAGTTGEWTLNNSIEDLKIGVDYLAKNFHFPNAHNIGILGHSTGALIGLLTALQEPRIRFGSVVTIVTSLSESYEHWFESGYNQEVKQAFMLRGELHPFIDNALDHFEIFNDFKRGVFSQEELSFPHRYGLLKSKDFFRFWSEIANSPNIISLTEKINIPLILFRGQHDEIMPIEKTDELFDRIKVTPKRKVLTQSNNHFHNDSWQLIQEESVKFFDELISNNPALR